MSGKKTEKKPEGFGMVMKGREVCGDEGSVQMVMSLICGLIKEYLIYW